VPDVCDLAGGDLTDVFPTGGDGIPDECQDDCNSNGAPDVADILAGVERDCNHNAVPDSCDIAAGFSTDALPPGSDGVPDECQSDCNTNGIPDVDDLRQGTSLDCNHNIVPDECDIAAGDSSDCNTNCAPDECDLARGASADCNTNDLPDECDVADQTSEDCNTNVIPDECEVDCNNNGVPDDCDLAAGTSDDIDHNGVPDECHGILRVPAQYATIQAAIDQAADGDSVLLADGVHLGPGNRNISFHGKDLLVCSENGPALCIVDGEGEASFFPVFKFSNDETPAAQLRGLTVTNGHTFFGGAVYCGSGSPTIRDCIFSNSEVIADGGAIYCAEGTAPVIRNCTIVNNSAGYTGGGIAAAEGSAPSLDSCVINGNLAVDGGAIACLLSIPVVNNCTIVNNTASGRGGALHCEGGQVEVRNSILWANEAAQGPELSLVSDAVLDLYFSNMAGGPGAVHVEGASVFNWNSGNLSLNPLFNRDGIHLRMRSPCRNAGDPDFVPSDAATDIDGQPRVLEECVDMGADEAPLELQTPQAPESVPDLRTSLP
jgi:hypothetical protein